MTASNLVIEGTAPEARTVIDRQDLRRQGAAGHRGGDITIRNLTLTRARVPDGNGAGIRAEGNGLTDRARQLHQQPGRHPRRHPMPDGTHHRPRQRVHPQRRLRRRLRARRLCQPDRRCCTSSTASSSRRSRPTTSSPAPLRTEVIDCDIHDGPNGTASYEIEAPNGGSLVVRGNTIEKGPKAENHTAMIMIGSEGVTQPTREITIENNTVRNDGNFPTTFVYNMTATEAVLKGNKLIGAIEPLHGEGTVQ